VKRVSLTRAIGLAVAVGAMALTGVAVAQVDNRTYEDKLNLPAHASKDPTVKIRVSGDGKSVSFTGPHERCGASPESPFGFNRFSATVGKIPKLKLKADGSFAGRREYRATSTSAYHTYHFDWDIKLSGRFVSDSKATGTVTYEMVISGTRSQGKARSCGRRTKSFTATPAK
jgi:hypothetical protein